MAPRESAFALEKTRASAARVMRRRFYFDFARVLGVLLLAGSVVACLLVLGSKAAWLPQVPWWGFAALAGASIAGASVYAVRARWSDTRAARELDRALGLNETLSSALELGARDQAADGAFVAELASRAEKLAASARADRAVAFRPGASWVAWPVLAAIAYACLLWVPDRMIRAQTLANKRAQESRAAAAEIRAVAQSVANAPQTPTPDPAKPALENSLAEIEEELRAGTLTPHDARVRTAEELSKRAQATETAARQNEANIEETRRALARAAARARRSAEGDRLSDALRKGDLESAASELERLAQSGDEAERRRAADGLEGIAREMSQQAESNAKEIGAEPPQSDSPDATPDPSRIASEAEKAAEDLRQPPSQPPAEAAPGAQQPAPEKPASAQDSVPKDEQQTATPPPSPSKEQAAKGTDGNSSKEQPQNQPQRTGSRDSANQQRADKSPNPSPNQDRERPPGQSQSPSQTPQTQPESQSGAPSEKTQGTQPESNQQQRPQQDPRGQERRQQPGQQQGPQQGQQPSQDPRVSEQQPGERGASQGRQPGQSTGAAPAPGTGVRSNGAERQEQSGSTSGERGGSGQPQAVPQKQPGQGTGRDAPAGDATPQSTGGENGSGARESARSGGDGQARAAERLAQDLRDLSRQRQNAQQQRETARGLRDKAEQLLENASPQERARLKEIADRLADAEARSTGSGGKPGSGASPWRGPTQTFDARPDSNSPPLEENRPAERTIAEWLSEPKPGGTAPAMPVQEPIRRASESAKQAIEQQTIPPQYSDLVRRVFKRYAESAKSPGGAPK